MLETRAYLHQLLNPIPGPGKNNVAAETLWRAFCGSLSSWSLKDIPEGQRHPGGISMFRIKNLPFSTDDVIKNLLDLSDVRWNQIISQTKREYPYQSYPTDGKNKYRFQESPSIGYD